MAGRHPVIIAVFLSVLVTASPGPSAPDIRPDETIVFYPTVASLRKDAGTWTVPVHAHVFESKPDSSIMKSIVEPLKKKFNISDPGQSEFFNKRMELFMADNQGWKKIHVKIGHLAFVLDNTSFNGHAQQDLQVPDRDMKKILEHSREKRKITVKAVLPRGDKRQFRGSIYLADDKPLFLISDIDDTIKISDVRNKKELMKNTLMNPFRAVPGMAGYYRSMAGRGTIIYYVSASPWQLYPEFVEFLKKESFPEGVFCLKYIRLKDTDFFNIFTKGLQYKVSSIEPIIKRFPGAGFILVGDSGEMDPEAYGAIASKYPGNIRKIIIRNAYSQDEPARYAKAFKGLPEAKWRVIRDADELNFR